jgi:hypothetical protein
MWAYLAVFVMFSVSAGFLVAILFVGSLNTSSTLLAKPELIATAGIRRTINAGIVFWQREYYLEQRNHTLAYKRLLPDHRIYYDIFEEWVEFE